MRTNHFNILVVEDSMADFLLIQQMLFEIKEFSKEIFHVETVAGALEEIAKRRIDLILLDLSLPDSYGMDTFDRVNRQVRDTPIIILTGLNDTRISLDAVKNGAQDYLIKGEFDEKLLVKSILYSIERKNSTELLRQSQETYRLLFENNPIPMYIREKESLKIRKVNRACMEHLGYKEEELLSMTIKDLYPPETDPAEFLSSSWATDAEGYSKPHIARHVKKDGAPILIECRARELVFDEKPCYIVLADDITEKRKVEEEVLFQANILKNVRDTIFVTDRRGIITYWNEGAEDTFGYLRNEILGRGYEFLYPEIDKPRVQQEQRDILSGKLTRWESKLVTRDDNILLSDNKASLLYGENNEVIGMIRVCKDITQEKKFAEKQKETVARLNSIFNNVVQSIVLIDSQCRIIAFNTTADKQCIQLMGLELQENTSFLDYLTAEMHPPFNEQLEKVFDNKLVQWEMPYRFSATSVHWYGFSLSPVADDTGMVLGVCVSMINITERKLSDEKFKDQYQEIENANKELDRLVKILSHDLRAPMNSVTGLIALAREEEDPKEFGNYLNLMERSVKKLEAFTKDVIASLRNREKAEIVEVNLHQLVQEIMEELRYADREANIEFRNELPEDLVISSYPAHLHIILSNLISNAIKYHDPAKERKYVRIAAIKQPLLLELQVEDNGIGIATEHHQRIFESYYTVGESSNSNGIGLSNVIDAVSRLRGTINLDSVPGQGSTFRISLPLV